MSDTIIMRHPTLPDDQEIEVPKDAMPHYTAAGWQLVPAEELQRRAAAKAQADAEAAAAEEKPEQPSEDEPEQSEPAESTTERPARSRRAHEKKNEES
ncbi:hypothetical protein ABZ636_03985 [Streptomyces sp. NPDC007251]|uniref:hypothetical protein n=1 Tax=Streptomyces sp. NPDC007251 TaxID=3154483 RepID=UPI0033C54888